MQTQIKTWLGVVIIIILAITAGVFVWLAQKNQPEIISPPIQPPISKNQKFCTQEAKICSDGTSVGRTGPNCEFAPCPSETNCAKEGESIGAVYPGVVLKECCDGLTPIIPKNIVGTQGICTKVNN
ncbi:MAG: hypothetical protein NT136_03990 [Candidatus Moranbacteria bacterium]|nr:hypothetical protein [Candidatus Moranbacteria bacterium]